MKIEKLTDSKIRVILNIDELEEKDIHIFEIINDDEFAEKFYAKLLAKASKEVDFDCESSDLLIEVFMSKEGFLIIVFTKVTDSKSSQIKNKSLKSKNKNYKDKKDEDYVYQFDNFENFCQFCTYLKNWNKRYFKLLAKHISLYEYQDKYYLVLTNINENSKYLKRFRIEILEFSDIIKNSANISGKLAEHGKAIFKCNALNNGIKYFTIA